MLKDKKISHTANVESMLRNITADQDIITAGLYHDHLEEGFPKKELKKKVSGKCYAIIKAVTRKNSDDVLQHLKKKIQKLKARNQQDIIDGVVMVKIADRADNLKRRLVAGDLTDKYIQKSKALIDYLLLCYKGKDNIHNLITDELWILKNNKTNV